MNGYTNGRANRRKKMSVGGELGEGVVGTKDSFKCKNEDARSLYYTLAIKDDPGWPEGVSKDHKAQITSPTPQDKFVTSCWHACALNKWHIIFFLLHVAV
jgi:hypothetical protein